MCNDGGSCCMVLMGGNGISDNGDSDEGIDEESDEDEDDMVAGVTIEGLL